MSSIGYKLIFLISLGLLLCPSAALAQVVHQELQGTVRAMVTEIIAENAREVTHTNVVVTAQTVAAEIKSGTGTGKIVTFENDLVTLSPGDKIFINHLVDINGIDFYQFKDVDRRFSLVWLGLLFVVLLIWFSRWHGLRALLSLGLSITAILFVLVPALLAGYNPIWVSLGVSGVILGLIFFITHGINPRSVIALFGTLSAVSFTCVIAALWVQAMRLTGFGSDASFYLNVSTQGQLDFTGLLLGSIIIGILGILDDVSITQASVVQELKAANQNLNLPALYQRAINVGRDHIGSLVNTLALAYVGVSLPLILLLAKTEDATMGLIINQEVVAAEILRIMIGSIGLILAVPLTTLLAAWWFAHGDRGREPTPQ